MLRTGQQIAQKQSLQQKLSPQQIQFVQLLQVPGMALEQRIKEEIELNPVLEDPGADPFDADEEDNPGQESPSEAEGTAEDGEARAESDGPELEDDLSPDAELDWEPFLRNTEYESDPVNSPYQQEEYRDLPNPYHESLLERLEHQVSLLDLQHAERLIAEQILGSLDEDGYFRRKPDAVADNLAFNHGVLVDASQVERIRVRIQQLDPVGIASVDLRDCLLAQLEAMRGLHPSVKVAARMLREEWEAFEKKQYPRLMRRLGVEEAELRQLYDLVRSLNPRPGEEVGAGGAAGREYIEPDFEVLFIPDESLDGTTQATWRRTAARDLQAGAIDFEDGQFVIRLHQRNAPQVRISPRYKRMWDALKGRGRSGDTRTRAFIKEKIESAQWFLDALRQRQQTLLSTMTAIVELQPEFFRTGRGLRPMILKDVAERVQLDISTISRVVNGKFVQTPHGVHELRYFFSEGVMTESGEEVSNREIKNALVEIVQAEDKRSPLSDQAIMKALDERGLQVARRTVSKYREMLQIPVARMRRELL